MRCVTSERAAAAAPPGPREDIAMAGPVTMAQFYDCPEGQRMIPLGPISA
jgi:hypothetical protein